VSLLPASRALSVLDLGSGRGGDLSKYRHLSVTKIRGVDVSQASIAEARRRTPVDLDAQFMVGDFGQDADLILRVWPGPFDLVVAFFTLQYVADSAPAVARVLDLARRVTGHGARLVVAVPDAPRVRALADQPDAAQRLASARVGPPSEWGATCQFNLAGAIDECPEYLVDSRLLVEVMESAGWTVEYRVPFDEADGLSAGLMTKMGAVPVATMRAVEREAVGLYTLVVARRPDDTPPAGRPPARPAQPPARRPTPDSP
jgi:mRNA (guanine-N7-)-methyltransferase